MRPRCRDSAFSVVELLVVISIIVLLVAMLLPALRFARQTAQRAHCQSNMRQMGAALNNFPNDHDGSLPGPSWYGQTPRYNHGTKDLSRWLANYMGLPAPEPTTHLNPYFICPSAVALIPPPQSPETSYQYGAMSERNPSTGLRVFGYPAFNGEPEYGPSKFTVVQSPSSAAAVRDIDYMLHPTAGWWAQTVGTPIHGYANGMAQRNYMFFDGHVEGRSEEQEFLAKPE
mgnify:CR=1 FL=1